MPWGDLDKAEGISPLQDITQELREETALLDTSVITLKGAIESVVSVTLNGIEVLDYTFEPEYNVVALSTVERGTLEVVYIASVKKGLVTTTSTPVGKFIDLNLVYKDQWLRFQGFLKPDGATLSSDGDMEIITDEDMYYVKGFSLYTIGGEPSFSFYNRNDLLGSAGVNTVSPFNVTLIEGASLDTTNTFTTRRPVAAVLGVRSKDVDVPYTINGDKITTDRYYPDVEVSYHTVGRKHHVQFNSIENGEVSMVVKNEVTDKRTNFDLLQVPDCTLPITYYVDIAGELKKSPSSIIGVSLEVFLDGFPFETVVVDNFGKVKIVAVDNGVYSIPTMVITPQSVVTLVIDAEVV